jgi:hypothetical protein
MATLHRHRLAAVHHAAKADVYARAGLKDKARGHRARAEWHAGFGRRQRFGSAPRGTELYNAEQLAMGLSDPTSSELFVDPVVASSGHTFEREAIVAWLRTNDTCPTTRQQITSVLVPNLHATSMVEQFVTAYATREGDEWAEIRAACKDRETRRQEPRQERQPDYSLSRADSILSERDAIAHIRERGTRDFPYGPDAFRDDWVRDEIIDRARGNTRREIDERYEQWASTGT